MTRMIETSDGTKVGVHPHAPDGCIDYGHEDYNTAETRNIQRKAWAYQDMIFKVINDNDLWQYIDEPGRMKAEYIRLRKEDPAMPDLLHALKLSIRGSLPSRYEHPEQYREVMPEGYMDYPLPGRIMFKQPIETFDWIIAQEMKAVFVFAVESLSEDPTDVNSKLFKRLKGLSLAEQSQLLKSHRVMFYLDEKKNKFIIPPGCCLGFTMFDDDVLPRNHPKVRIVKYDHANPKHNKELQADGTYASMTAYAGEPVKAGGTTERKVILDVEE